MTNRSKNIGTACETAVRKALMRAGYSKLEAHRNVLAGAADQGDVWLRHPDRGLIIFEVKGGHTAEMASLAQINKWLIETEKEMANAGAEHAFLVVKRRGVGLERAEQWRVFLDLTDIATLGGWDKQLTSFPWRRNALFETTLGYLLGLFETGAWVASEETA